MLFKWFRKNERGSVMVVVAITMSVLLGITGLAVDFGSLALTRQELQNAADAAALAAGQDKLNGLGVTTQTSTANAYIVQNGYTPGDGITVSEVNSSGSTVRVTITTQKNVGFSSVLTGRNVEQVSATAVAEVMNTVGNYPYALFAGVHVEDGSGGITGNGNNMIINGNVHSNTDVSLKKATVNGVVTAVDDIEYQGTKKSNTNDPFIPMPNTQSIVDLAKSGAIFDGSEDGKNDDVVDLKKMGGFDKFIEKALEMTTPDPQTGLNIYINGSIEYKGNGATFENTEYPVNLVVKGDITLGGIPLRSKASTPFVLVSETGDITVNGQGTSGGAFYGLVLAPTGNVELNGGNNSVYNGSIYAMNITKNGAGLTVNYDSSVSNHLPSGKVRLIE